MDKLGRLQAEQRRRAYYITGAVMALAERDDLTDAQVRERVKALAKVYNAGTLQERINAEIALMDTRMEAYLACT